MTDQDAYSKNFAFNYQSDIFNQKAPSKPEYNYSHKGFQPTNSNQTSYNFLSWDQPKSNVPVKNSKIKRDHDQPKQTTHNKFEEKLYSNEPKKNIENNRGQKETLFLGNYEGEEYKVKRQKGNDYNPNLYYKTKKPEQVKIEQIYGNQKPKGKPSIQRNKVDNKIDNNKIINNNERIDKKLESLNVERSTNNEYNPKFDPKQNRVNMLKSNIFNSENVEKINNEDKIPKKEEKKVPKKIINDKKDNFGKKSKFNKNEEKIPLNLDWRDTKTNLLFNSEMNKDIMKKDARQRKFKEIYGSDPVIPKQKAENNFKINDRNLIEKATKEKNPDLNEAKIKKISENISQIQGDQFINKSSKFKIKNNNDDIKSFEINSDNINQRELEKAFADKGIKIYDVKENTDSILGNIKNNKITFKVRNNDYDKDFNKKITSIKNEFKNKKNAEIKIFSQEDKKRLDLIPSSVKWDNANIGSIINNKNIDKTLQEKTHSKPLENTNNEKMTNIFVNLKYKNEQSII
jgi:hypothetical protein